MKKILSLDTVLSLIGTEITEHDRSFTDEDLAALQARNKQRVQELIVRMGPTYCLHPDHAPTKKEPK